MLCYLGLGRSCDILQMALVDMSKKVKPWNQYIQPTQRIHSGASAVNKLTVVNNKLCYNGVECSDVVSIEECIERLWNYLYQNFPAGAVLIAHNGARFDFPLLKRDLMKYDKVHDKKYKMLCIDSIKLFKTQFPGLEAYNQPYLIQRFLGSENVSSAHEAVGDCVNLRSAIEAASHEKNISLTEFLSIPGKPLLDDGKLKKEEQPDLNIKLHKTKKKICSETTINKIHKRKVGRIVGNYYLRRR